MNTNLSEPDTIAPKPAAHAYGAGIQGSQAADNTADSEISANQHEQAANLDEEPEKPKTPEQSWSHLPTERHQIIRLAPLPADRETGLRPLLFATLGRVSRHNEKFSMLKLTVQIVGQKTAEDCNTLEIWADHEKKEIRLRQDDVLKTIPGNRGLGRFILALASRWVNKHWAHYGVQTAPLLIKHTPSDNARLRRDHALQAQGFTVVYEDSTQMRGNCSAVRANQLHANWNIEKIRIIEATEAAEILQTADQTLKEQEKQIRKLGERIGLLKRDDQTLKFSITMLVIFTVFQAGLLIWMATH